MKLKVRKRNYYWYACSLVLYVSLFFLSGCGEQVPSAPAMVSVSSDGKYALSTHYGRYLLLWDIEHKKKRLISKKASIFSPYFIKGTHYFLWQNFKSKEVVVHSVNGDIIKTLNPGFTVYGHVMTSDLSNYVASKANWSLYQYKNGVKNTLKPSFNDLTGSARLLQMSLENNFLLTAGHGGAAANELDSNNILPLKIGVSLKEIYPHIPEHRNRSMLREVSLWDVAAGKPIKKFIGNIGKTTAAISPDERYVAAGDENNFFYIWETKTGKRKDTAYPVTYTDKYDVTEEQHEYFKSAARENRLTPPDFYSIKWASGCKLAAVKFIDTDGHLIRFCESTRYGVLYHAASSKVQGFMDLGNHPHPTTFSLFSSARTIDTAPNAKILVMGQSRFGEGNDQASGIIVYRFDEQTKQLIRLWAPKGPKPHWRIHNPDDEWEG